MVPPRITGLPSIPNFAALILVDQGRGTEMLIKVGYGLSLVKHSMSANRPTWTPATGSSIAPSAQYSSKDLASHKSLKLRRGDAKEALSTRDLRAELLVAESKLKSRGSVSESTETTAERREDRFEDDFDVQTEKALGDDTRRVEGSEASTEEDSTKDLSESEDETESLLKELEKIKKERELERSQKEEELRVGRERAAVRGNPLLFEDEKEKEKETEFLVKRSWTDDIVFKGQARSAENNPKKRFINDTVRSDFHRKFLDRYIR